MGINRKDFHMLLHSQSDITRVYRTGSQTSKKEIGMCFLEWNGFLNNEEVCTVVLSIFGPVPVPLVNKGTLKHFTRRSQQQITVHSTTVGRYCNKKDFMFRTGAFPFQVGPDPTFHFDVAPQVLKLAQMLIRNRPKTLMRMWLFTLMWIEIQLPNKMRVRIRKNVRMSVKNVQFFYLIK
jgi:hypothetical protein